MNILWYVDKQFDVAFDKTTWIEIIRYLQRNNDVFLITGYRKNKIQFNELNNEVIYIDSLGVPFFNRFMFYFNQTKNFEKFIKKYKPARILFNTNNFFVLKKAVHIKENYGYKSFLDIRTLSVSSDKVINAIDSYLFKCSLKVASESFEGITYITEEIKNYCQKKFNLQAHRSAVWTSGVDINLFKPRDEKNDNKTFRLIYHGNIACNRGLDKVIKALNHLRSYDIALFLLGSGNGVAGLKRLASRLKLEERVIFHPAIPYKEVPEFICKANAGILPFPNWPGWNTSSPIKLFEYLSCNKLVIATEIPAHINALQGKDFVFWAKKSSPEELARAIKEIYDRRKQFKSKDKEAREFVIKNYTWEKQAKKLEKFILS